MAGLRTAADVKADYDIAHAAYQEALKLQSFSEGDGEGGQTSGTRQDVERLHRELMALSAEYARLTGGGIRLLAAIPAD